MLLDDVLAHDHELEFTDEFDTPELDRSRWLPYHLPQWSSRERSAARYELADGCLQLVIEPDQPAWCPEFDGANRVSSLQTGVFSGPLGSAVGQHRFDPAAVVREPQAPLRLYTPHFGAFVLRARAELDRDSMVALWMIGFEERPEESGEICICEIFGSAVTERSAEVGMGVHPFGDPNLVDDFVAVELPIDVREFHDYAGVWTPTGVSFYLDGEPVRAVDQSPDYPMQIMLGLYRFAAEPTTWQPRFVIDSFRGYRRTAAD